MVILALGSVLAARSEGTGVPVSTAFTVWDGVRTSGGADPRPGAGGLLLRREALM